MKWLGKAVAMVAIIAALPLTHETVSHRITLRRAVRPLLHVPKSIRPVFPIAAGCYIAAWGIGIFFQSLSTPAAVQYFGSTDPLVPALILALAMAPSAAGGPMSARTTMKFSLVGGSVLMFASCIALYSTLSGSLMIPFLVLCAVFAVACGIILSASMHMLISYSEPSESASVVSLINFAGYVGTTLLSVAMSGLASALSLAGVLAFITVLGGLFMIPGTLCGLKMLRKQNRPSSRVNPSDSHFPIQTIAQELTDDSYTAISCEPIPYRRQLKTWQTTCPLARNLARGQVVCHKKRGSELLEPRLSVVVFERCYSTILPSSMVA